MCSAQRLDYPSSSAHNVCVGPARLSSPRILSIPVLPPSNQLCRRATSHKRFVIRRRPNAKLAAALQRKRPRLDEDEEGEEGEGAEGAAATGLTTKPLNRAMRRRPARLHADAVHATAPQLLLPPEQALDAVAGGGGGGGAVRAGAVGQDPADIRSMTSLSAVVEASDLLALRYAATHAWGEKGGPAATAAAGGPALASPAAATEPIQGATTGGGGFLAPQGQEGTAAAAAVAAAAGGGQQRHPPRPLETHAWHARRMRMHPELWGHTLALHAAGRGRGSRSFLHQLRAHCVMHDASYWGCLQLAGHQRDAVALLRRVW